METPSAAPTEPANLAGGPPRRSGRVRLAYGDCLTIDSSQGLTSDEHVNALPGGSRSVQGFKAYVAESRHRVAAWLVGSMGAELRLGFQRSLTRAASDEGLRPWQFWRTLAVRPLLKGRLLLPRDIDDPGRAGAIGATARERVRSTYLGTRHLTQYMQLIEQMLRSDQAVMELGR